MACNILRNCNASKEHELECWFLYKVNLENNKLQGPLPQSLNKETLEIRTSVSFRGRNGYAELGCCKSLFLQRNQSSYKKLKEVIGRGSFGSVYLGKIPDEKSVVVKSSV
ncbi:hypothetical protein JHK87_050677 [Glycine soja]|nr:hypothetical protein JHK87_050677 [Glycine soja]